MGHAAEKSRRRTLTLLRKAQEVGQSVVDQAGGAESLMTDLLRCVGEFDQALQKCNAGLQKRSDDILRQVLGFQIRLMGSRDVRSHVVSEAEGNRSNA